MRVCRLLAVFIVLMAAQPVPATADSLVIPNISPQPGHSPEDVVRPTRAMTMDQVRDQFGPPLEVVGPVGNPPITRWVYDKFVVHFEGEYVIHSVIRRKP